MEQDREWVHWDVVLEQDRDWKAALNLESDVLWKFKLSATEDQLPTQTMLKRWNYVKKDTCHVCGAAAGSLSHILSRCSRSLNQGRYTWRHDSILLAIYETVREVVNRANARVKKGISRLQKESIAFISGSSLQSDSEVKTEAQSVKWKTATAPQALLQCWNRATIGYCRSTSRSLGMARRKTHHSQHTSAMENLLLARDQT